MVENPRHPGHSPARRLPRPPADLEAIEDALLRLSRLAEDVLEIGEIDLNPIFAFPPGAGCRIADARIRVRTAR